MASSFQNTINLSLSIPVSKVLPSPSPRPPPPSPPLLLRRWCVRACVHACMRAHTRAVRKCDESDAWSTSHVLVAIGETAATRCLLSSYQRLYISLAYSRAVGFKFSEDTQRGRWIGGIISDCPRLFLRILDARSSNDFLSFQLAVPRFRFAFSYRRSFATVKVLCSSISIDLTVKKMRSKPRVDVGTCCSLDRESLY